MHSGILKEVTKNIKLILVLTVSYKTRDRLTANVQLFTTAGK